MHFVFIVLKLNTLNKYKRKIHFFIPQKFSKLITSGQNCIITIIKT